MNSPYASINANDSRFHASVRNSKFPTLFSSCPAAEKAFCFALSRVLTWLCVSTGDLRSRLAINRRSRRDSGCSAVSGRSGKQARRNEYAAKTISNRSFWPSLITTPPTINCSCHGGGTTLAAVREPCRRGMLPTAKSNELLKVSCRRKRCATAGSRFFQSHGCSVP